MGYQSLLKRRSLLLLSALVVSLLAAFFGLGLSYQQWLASSVRDGAFRGIGRDGWISHDAQMRLDGLLDSGNRLSIQFGAWRPAPAPETEVRVSVCGEPREQWIVKAGTQVEVSLRGACEPRLVRFDVPNPFVGAGRDKRQLGAQIGSLKVTSRLRVPLVDLERVLSVGLCLFLLATLLYLPFQRAPFGGTIVLVVPLLGLWLLSEAPFWNLTQPSWLWLTATVCAVGVALGRALRAQNCPGNFISSEAKPLEKSWVWVALALVIVVAGGLLRAHGVAFGLPHNYHPDEVPKVNAIEFMRANHSLNPNYFLHPSLLLYSTYALTSLLQWAGVDLEFRTCAFLSGRLVSVLAGSASIYLLFLIGRQLYSSLVGVLAAFILAFAPLHVTCSRYLKEDALLCFFILLSMMWMLRAVREDRTRYLFYSAAAAGLSASTKYSGFLTAGIVCVAPFLRSRSWVPDWRFLRYTIGALLVVPLCFLLASPFVLLNWRKFWSDFQFERRHMTRGHTQAIDAWSQYWMYHLGRSVVPGLTVFSALMGVLGAGVLLWRRRIEDLFIVAIVLAFYLPAEWVKAKPAPQPERYIFPCLPFLALAAAEATRVLWSMKLKVVPLVLGIALCVSPLVRSLMLARDIDPDTREQAQRWMEGTLPRGTELYIDWQPYQAYFTSGNFAVESILREGVEDKLTISALTASGKQYLLLSSLFYDRYFVDPNGDPIAKSRIRTIFQRLPIVREFTAPSGTYGFHNPRLTLFSLSSREIAKLETELRAKELGERERTSNEFKTVFNW